MSKTPHRVSPTAAVVSRRHKDSSPPNTALNNPVTRAIKGFASLFIGIPCAVVATCVLGAAYIMADVTKNAVAQFRRYALSSQSQLVYNPTLVALTDFFEEAISKTWTEFGIYGFAKTAELFREQAEAAESEMGFGGAANDPDDANNIATLKGGEAHKQHASKLITNKTLQHLQRTLNLTDAEAEEWQKWMNSMPEKTSSLEEGKRWMSLRNEDGQELEGAAKVLAVRDDFAKRLVDAAAVNDREKLQELMVEFREVVAKAANKMHEQEMGRYMRPRTSPEAPINARSAGSATHHHRTLH